MFWYWYFLVGGKGEGREDEKNVETSVRMKTRRVEREAKEQGNRGKSRGVEG